MNVMILAAGLGLRMKPLTDKTPKPLLSVGEHTLIEHHIKKLAGLNIKHLVINTSYLSDLIVNYLGDGNAFDMKIDYSIEPGEPLGTAGGIINALPYMDESDILVINSDVYSDYDYSKLLLPRGSMAHLALVTNPDHHITGDFHLSRNQLLGLATDITENYTFSGIGVYKKSIFEDLPKGKLELKQVFIDLIDQEKLTGEVIDCQWIDVGTPERLELARNINLG